jgi:hypothetical protein
MKLESYLPETPAYVQTEQRMSEIANMLDISKSGETYRAQTLGTDTSFVNSWLRQQMAYRQQMINDLMTIAYTVEEIRSPITHITNEVFRRGIVWKQRFAVKCNNCGREYLEKVKICEDCPKEFAPDFSKPDEKQKERAHEFLKDCNIWDQSLEEVLRKLHFDLNAIDDAYMYLVKEYKAVDGESKVHSKLIEVRRLDPAAIEIDVDESGLPKNSHFICYIHRDNDTDDAPGKCEGCGRTKVPAMYKYTHRGATLFLLDSEVVHQKKFNTDETYGWSPILTIFEKVMTLKGMDSYLYRYFFERKMPSSMIMVFTDDPESLRRERQNIAAQMKLDPHYIPMVAVSSRQNRGRVDMMRLFHTLQEMDYLPVRQEIRERIAAMWGVTPAWQGAPEAAGGLSSQTQQLVVMSRVVESDQRIFHEKFLPHILEAFGVTDWEWELPQPEEKAESTRLSFASQKISAANMLFNMGFDVSIKNEGVGIAEIEFLVSGDAQRAEDPYGGGGFGGGGEGGPPGGGQGFNQDTGGQGQSFQMMEMAGNFVGQIQNAGHPHPDIQHTSEDGGALYFKSNGQQLVAKFENGKITGIEKYSPVRLHRHGTLGPHPIDMPHADNRSHALEDPFKADEPEEPEMPDVG